MNKFAIKESDRLRSSKRGHRASMVPQLIECGYATYWDMAERLGVPKEDAERRYQNAKRRGLWPISYSDLT